MRTEMDVRQALIEDQQRQWTPLEKLLLTVVVSKFLILLALIIRCYGTL